MATVTTRSVEKVVFGCYTEEEWKKIGVRIDDHSVRGSDKTNGTPYDLRLGALDNGVTCETCGEKNDVCPGHFGYIELEEPCYNPEYISYVVIIFKCICIYCSEPRISRESAESQNILSTRRKNRLRAFRKKAEGISSCSHCSRTLPSDIYQDGYEIKYETEDDNEEENEKSRKTARKKVIKTITAKQAYPILLQIRNSTLQMLGFNDGIKHTKEYGKDHPLSVRPEAFIYTVLPVIPTCSRPWVKNVDRKDDDITERYNTILKENKKLKKLISEIPLKTTSKKGKKEESQDTKIKKTIANLYRNIWQLSESEKDTKTNRQQKGFKDRLCKKEGHIQSNVGGKRCDFNLRTVIVGAGSLDIRIGQVGIPEEAARKVTYREKITKWNIGLWQERLNLQIAIHHDPKLEPAEYIPFINSIERGGFTINMAEVISRGEEKVIGYNEKIRLRVGDMINRQQQNGDYNLVNRQPTLRIESIQGKETKIMRGEKVQRIPLGTTVAYNADQQLYYYGSVRNYLLHYLHQK